MLLGARDAGFLCNAWLLAISVECCYDPTFFVVT